jgi:hypothetical protein
MKLGLCAATCVLALIGASVEAQTRPSNQTNQARQGQTQFNTQDRQATSDWYTKNQAHPPAGFRPQDRLSPAQESRLQVGSKLDPELQKRVQTVPVDLKRQLAAPAPSYRYVALGGHVALVDKKNQVHDIIHVHQ